ncbi:MAG: metallophosphatase family protein [Thaumarchaeota archaeon]|nr:metallophosphatase family protein [Nitrososphaerota archaeon]
MVEPQREFAFVSDVHSNFEALRAVLDDMGRRPLYCLGDSVGYGASPNEVVDLLKEKGATCVLGNHDFAALNADPSGFNSRAAVAVIWTSRHLSDENKGYLAEFPLNRTVELAGERVYMTHGSPDDNLGEYVYPTTHSDMFDFYLRKLSVKAIALGHTHIPFAWSERQGVVFNPGSVGQPRDGDRRASYAILSVNGGKVEVEHRRVEYDVETSAKKIIEAGLPPSLANRLLTGE